MGKNTITILGCIGKLALIAVSLATIGGCDLFGDRSVTLRLVNRSASAVDPQIYVANTPTAAGQLFNPANRYTGFTKGPLPVIAPNAVIEDSLECEDAAAIGVATAVLTRSVTGESIVLHALQDYACGDSITFEYLPNGAVKSTVAGK
jgi:hypothetical protein